jgi:putative ABC transport system permease protein
VHAEWLNLYYIRHLLCQNIKLLSISFLHIKFLFNYVQKRTFECTRVNSFCPKVYKICSDTDILKRIVYLQLVVFEPFIKMAYQLDLYRYLSISVMLFNYLTVALRNLAKNRLFSLINISGLSIGLATGMLLLLWVRDEVSFDRHHPDSARIFRENAHFKSGTETQSWETTPASHAAYALREIPEVEKAVRIVEAGAPVVEAGNLKLVEEKGVFTDPDFFFVFKNDILAGNTTQPFADATSVVLTESFARKYFGSSTPLENVIGKTIKMDKDQLIVSAVVADFPENTDLKYDYFRPYQHLINTFEPNDYWKSREEDWGDFGDVTYYKLRPGASAAAVATKLGQLQHTHNAYDSGSYFSLQALGSVHLYAADGRDTGAQTVYIMGIAGLFILLIACINYINLATARATKRAREVGMRKAIGAQRSQLVRQFMVESAVVFAISTALSVVLTYVLLPYCNALADKKMRIDWSDPGILGLLGGVLGGALLLSALYPALVLSAFSPLQIIKGRLGSHGRDTQGLLRRGLVVMQFVCSSALLLAMFVIGRQMQFIQTKDLGYDREHVFQIRLSEQTYKNREALLHELENSPGVQDVSAVSGNILHLNSNTGDTDWDGKTADNSMIISPLAVAPDFIDFFKLKLVAGRNFSGTQADSTSYILNETAAAQVGGDVVGKRFKLWQTEGTIIGVVKDFHFASVRQSIRPAVMMSRPRWQSVLCVRTTGADAARAVDAAEALWKRFDAAYPFDFSFMDEDFNKMYRREQRTNALFKAFSAIAMLISCLGLFGLSAFTIEQRTREIGVRKVLGASVRSITALLATDFLKLVLLALLIASPLAWYFMRGWLADFAYRIDMQWWMFASAGLAAVVIATLTVSFQSIRAALSNPVRTLRSE